MWRPVITGTVVAVESVEREFLDKEKGTSRKYLVQSIDMITDSPKGVARVALQGDQPLSSSVCEGVRVSIPLRVYESGNSGTIIKAAVGDVAVTKPVKV